LPSCLVGIKACASSHHWSREGAKSRRRSIAWLALRTGSHPRRARLTACVRLAST
jgi:hypothetical protein